jgi:histidinol-phosphate phosphatase family protein
MSVGAHHRLPLTADFFSSKKTIILDRDGVLNEKPPKASYVRTWQEFRWLPGALTALRLLHEAGYRIVIASNQAGIGRGQMSQADLSDIHAAMKTEVSQAGGSFFTFDQDGVQTTIPVFWDPTFLAKKKAMIAALGAHFTSNTAIKIVCVSFANANSEDWSVPHTPADVSAWEALGYTSDKVLDAGKQIIDAAMAAFPNQYLTLAVGGNGNLDPDVDPQSGESSPSEQALAWARQQFAELEPHLR